MVLRTLCVVALTFISACNLYAQEEDFVVVTADKNDSQREHKTNSNEFKANYGIGWYTSEFSNGYQTNKDVSTKCGSLSYHHFWHPNTSRENCYFGIGAHYVKALGTWNGTIEMTYYGPSLAFAVESEDARWRLGCSISLGHGEMEWNSDKLSGFGGYVDMSLVYKFTNNVGFALGFNIVTVRDGKYSKELIKGSQAMNLMIGPEFYF